MLPWRSGARSLSNVLRNGSDVTFEIMTVKGIEYAVFPAASGGYVANYLLDTVQPTVTTPHPGRGRDRRFHVDLDSRRPSANPWIRRRSTATTFEVRDASSALVPGTVSLSSGSLTATFVPTSLLANGTTYTVTVRGGASDPRAKDQAGNALAANASWSFTTAAPPTCPCSIWAASASPAVASDSDTSSVELGVKFRSDINGFIKGIRFYKGPANTGTHVGTLWSVVRHAARAGDLRE